MSRPHAAALLDRTIKAIRLDDAGFLHFIGTGGKHLFQVEKTRLFAKDLGFFEVAGLARADLDGAWTVDGAKQTDEYDLGSCWPMTAEERRDKWAWADRPEDPIPAINYPPLEINSVRDQAVATLLAERHRHPLDDRVYDMGAPSPVRWHGVVHGGTFTLQLPVRSKWRITIPYWTANLSWQPLKAEEPGLLVRLVLRHLLGFKVVDTSLTPRRGRAS